MLKYKKAFYFLLVLIITIPSFISLINNSYFTMHDDQHIARLFLLDEGMRQGDFFPRWVDILGFNLGYPLFNFYPPLIYYVSEFFHLLGISFIWSIKLMIFTGFFLSAYGMFLFAKNKIGNWGGLLAAALYTYTFYHAVLVYVRGAFAEFFTLALLPFVFLTFENFWEKPGLKNGMFFAITFALLTLTHTLIAFPTIFFLGIFTLYYLFKRNSNKIKSLLSIIAWGLFGLGLSAFFWLPSLFERKFTLLDKVFPTELSNYQLHFICPQQFFYSLWGYGGSIQGCADGMTFQLGKVHIALFLLSLIMLVSYIVIKKNTKHNLNQLILYSLLTLLSLFMTTKYSQNIWEIISYFQYMQFPWRFLGFASFFISISGAYAVFIFLKIFKNKIWKSLSIIGVIGIIFFLSIYYQKYFVPNEYVNKTDKQLTSFDEIAWRVSRSSFDFLPTNVSTRQSQLGTTIPDIQQKSLSRDIYEIINGEGDVLVVQNSFKEKKFLISAVNDIEFRANTFNFPGWAAYINEQKVNIRDDNDLKLITINIPKGDSLLDLKFENTAVRSIGNLISMISVASALLLLLSLKLKKIKG